ncbi:hypothetical protein PENSTE_c025G02877 [Penicillium steckii]|uniref:Uncharacterized protein n=1 Tax=Penicillium steckii TaxID=303698 RepID=A0A1V6SQJ9_9EURO|nr:hypothetical protein PENSTE_c025G02877 [Penicillium steckii]
MSSIISVIALDRTILVYFNDMTKAKGIAIDDAFSTGMNGVRLFLSDASFYNFSITQVAADINITALLGELDISNDDAQSIDIYAAFYSALSTNIFLTICGFTAYVPTLQFDLHSKNTHLSTNLLQ